MEASPSAGVSLAVPASTSNLGPGFDLLGLALSLFLRVEAHPRNAAASTLVTGDGCADWPEARSNKLVLAFLRGWEALGAGPPPALEFRVHSEIPVSRGLGSSAAAIVAGLLIARAFARSTIAARALLPLAIELEGHPDNVTPALLGGCTATLPRDGAAPLVVSQAIHPDLGVALAWPSTVMPTAHARALLPKRVAFTDAVANARHLAILLEGLRTGDAELLRAGSADRLHVPYRVPRIAGAAEALDAALDAGAHLATLSGSGSALFALAPRELAAAVGEAMQAALARAHERAWSRVVEVIRGAPAISVIDDSLER